MKTITKQVFEYSELTGSAQERAAQWLRECVTSFEWWDFVDENWKEKLQGLGYSDVKIYFSGFASQGDGAQFVGKIDLADWMKAHKVAGKNRSLYNEAKDGLSGVIRSSGHYSHEYCTSFEFDWPQGDKAYDQMKEVETLIIETSRQYMREIYKELKEEYWWLVSDESIKDLAEANEYTFDKYGKREG